MNEQGEIPRPTATAEPAQLKDEGFTDEEADATPVAAVQGAVSDLIQLPNDSDTY